MVFNLFFIIIILADSLDDAGFTINTIIRFQESKSQLDLADIPINVLDDSMPEKQQQFIVSILRVDIISTELSTGSTDSARTAIEGESVRITIFDNDCEYISGIGNMHNKGAHTCSVCWYTHESS